MIFYDVNLLIKNQEAQISFRNNNPRTRPEKAKARVKGLTKGDDRLNRKEDDTEIPFKLKSEVF